MRNWFIITLLLFIACAAAYPLKMITALDINVTLFSEKMRSPFLTDFFLFISDIGSIKFYLPISAAIAVFFILKRKVLDALLLLAILFSVRLLNYQLKEIFSRERPHFNAVYEASHYSFPSGHSMNSAAIYSFICYILITRFIHKKYQKQAMLLSTIILIALIGISRIYLGVHYLTDVIAGFSAGIAWFIIVATIFDKMGKKFDKNRSI
ncbi:phosphatase PAP2 family protein [Bacillus sp. SA1-12]|uniref:phosphatase PAP2 family protein n=1 Tax=Bacillus sp. SA1-12 TaxID=1455638 RepID=UPI000696634F|nr:phosphatase PAP2 family protein [Bacillus sp. SA1-12]